MNTSIEKVVAGIVITAEVYNPSIFSETWLIQKGIIPQESLVGPRIVSPGMAQFGISNCQVLVIPQKMQIIFPITDEKDNCDLQRRIASESIKLLPQTPYQALGINFDFFVTQPEGCSFNEYDRRLLGSGDYNLLKEFTSEDAKFGRYFSKNYNETRMKLDIKPVIAGPNKLDLIQFAFNYHYDVSGCDMNVKADKLIQYLEAWYSLRNYALYLVEAGSTF